MNKQLDEILDFCFEGEVSWIEYQLDGTSDSRTKQIKVNITPAEWRRYIEKEVK